MRYITTIIFCLVFGNNYSQNVNNENTYKCDSIYMQYLGINTETGKTETAAFIPFGTSGQIVFNSFFKSYKISFKDSDGVFYYINLHYLSQQADGSLNMADQDSIKYTLTDNISIDNTLILTFQQPIEGKLIATLFFVGIN
ncbi:MAG: hypothetical protein IPI31_10790 [Bacteroidetes bacterium]|nr:hypothetical protein [Bacteroidota bacterium]